MTDIFIIDNHKILIDSLIRVFNNIEDKFKVYGYSTTAKDAIEELKTSKAEIVILDLILPDMSGADLCKHIKQNYPSKKIIVLTGESRPEILKRAWDFGANAILSKCCDLDELINTIFDVILGIRVIGSQVPEISFSKKDTDPTLRVYLTEKEKLILSLLAQGNSRKQIGHILGNTKNTIDTHCRSLFIKFDKRKMVDVLLKAKKWGLIQ